MRFFKAREKEIALGQQLAKEFRSLTTHFENADISGLRARH